MTRHLITAISIGFFLLMMTLLTRDHIVPMLEYGDATMVSGAQLAESWSGTDEWMTLSFNGQRIGGMRQSVTKFPDGFVATGRTLIRAGFVRASLETAASMNERLELEQVRMALRLGDGKEIELAGLVEQTTLHLRLESDTGVRHTRIPLREAPTLNISSDALFAGRMMKTGESYLMDVYDPLWGMQAGKMRVAMIGTEEIETETGTVEARIAEAAMQNIRMRIWLDELELPLRREISYTPNAARRRADAGEARSAFVLRMDRMSEKEKAAAFFESLHDEPPAPDFSPDDFQGEDRGEPLEASGLLPLLFRSQFQALKNDTDGEDND